VGWLLLAGLGIMWLAFLLPSARRHPSPSTTVDDFERRMELLAQAEAHGSAGRWIITPRKGVRFVGTAERKKVRARERRRQVFTFQLEAIAITFLIGLVPPLRVMWSITALFGVLLLLYVWLLLSLKGRGAAHPNERMAAARAPERAHRRLSERHVAQGGSSWARPTLNGLGLVGEGDRVHVVVKPAGEMGVAGY
jgi:hypothetical protein